jgi:hypothetical protein
MSLADARYHPWLQSYTPFTSNALVDAHPHTSIGPDVSMLSSVDEPLHSSGPNGDTDMSHGLEHMQLDQNVSPASQNSVAVTPSVPGAFPNSQNNGNGIRREGSRSLQRRSQVLSQAAETAGPSSVPEPSWEMVQNIAPQEADTAEMRGHNKRIHAELSPLPEEHDTDMVNPPRHSNSPRKKGKGSDEESPPKTPVKAVRGKGKAVAPVQTRSTRNRAATTVREDAVSDDEEMSSGRPRRSSRQAPRGARRA